MKIMHLAQSAGYGVTIYVESLIKKLSPYGYSQVLLGSDYYNTGMFRGLVDELITIPMDRNITKRDITTILRCRKIIRSVSPDILYCHSAKAGIYGRIACIGLKTKVVYNPHGWAFNMKCSRLKKNFYAVIESIFTLFTDRIINISNYELDSTPCYMSKTKMKIIKNGIDIELCDKLLKKNELTRSMVGIPPKAFVIGLIARISHQKGQDMLVDVARKVKDRIPNAFFVIVGGKSDEIDIESIIKSAHMENDFLITGEVKNAIKYASLFDVAVLTSRWEGFGLVLPEYMMAQKPIVAFCVDAIPEIIENENNGILVKAGDTDAFAAAICRLHNDKGLCEKFIEQGKVIVRKEFSIDRVAREHHEVFLELTNTVK